MCHLIGMTPVLLRFWLDDRGATAIEYGLIAGIIALSVVLGATAIGTKLQTRYFQPVANGLS